MKETGSSSYLRVIATGHRLAQAAMSITSSFLHLASERVVLRLVLPTVVHACCHEDHFKPLVGIVVGHRLDVQPSNEFRCPNVRQLEFEHKQMFEPDLTRQCFR